MNVLKTGWGGKGEHGVLEVDMTLTEDDISFSLIEKNYNDWGRQSVLDSEFKKAKKVKRNGERLTVQFLYELLKDWIENECGMVYYRIKVEDVKFPMTDEAASK